MNCTWTCNFCNSVRRLCFFWAPWMERDVSLSADQYLEWVSWNLAGRLEILWSTPKLWRCLWPASVNEFFLFFLRCIRLLILPWVSVSLSLCVSLAYFPPYVSSPHSLHHSFSLSRSVSSLFTFVLPWSDLDKPNSSDPWYPVLPPAFPLEWTNLMINSLALSCAAHWYTHTHTHTVVRAPNCHGALKSAQRSCLPTNYHTTSPALPPVPTPHLCASVPQSIRVHCLLPFHT